MSKNLFSGLLAIGILALAHSGMAQTPCGTDWINQRYGEQHPERMDYRTQMRELIRVASFEPGTTRNTIVIPTVVHVMHRGGTENVSNAQVEDAIRVLNTDMRRQNGDTANTRPIFKMFGADFNVEFRLAKLDPQGNCTNGITNTFSPITYAADDAIKQTSEGGIDAWPVNRYFNIWVVGRIQLDQSGVIGYAYFPSWGMSGNYGVVIDNRYFGTIGSAHGKDGRTLTHEVGHCLELYHTFQSGCGSDCSSTGDDVCDTPPVSGSTFTCSFALNSCSNDAQGPSPYNTDVPEMVENYMSYNQDFCQNIFTLGQKSRSDAVFVNTFVAQLITQQNLLSTGTSDGFIGNACALAPDFTWSKTLICVGDSVQFGDLTHNGTPDTWQWTITGPQTLTATGHAPAVTFTQPGLYTVTLTVTNGAGSPTVTKQGIIRVVDTANTPEWMFFDGFDNQPLATGRWIAHNLAYGHGWEEKNTAATGNNTVYINNANNAYDDLVYELYSPAYDLTGIEAPKVRFKTAFAGRGATPTDKLKMYISNDCGVNWILRFAKTGDAIASMPSGPQPIEPTTAAHWTTWENNVPPGFETSTHYMLKFVFETGGGNNFYLDDINIVGASAIEESDKAALAVFPNPVADELTIDLRTLNEPQVQLSLYDMSGRLIVSRAVNGGSLYTFSTRAVGLAQGMYRVSVKGKSTTFTTKIIVTE